MSEEKKGFFKKLMEKIDKKMEAKAKQSSCCCCGPAPKGPDKNKKSSCCS